MKSELLKFLIDHLNEKSNFKDIRIAAENAIQSGMQKNVKAKETWIFSALTELCSLKDITITFKKILLQSIEVIMLSRRISDTNTRGIFSNKVYGNANHVWLISGAKLLISSLYAGLNVEYITIDADNDLSKILDQLKQCAVLWVVVGYSESYHLTLLRLELGNDNLQIQVLDSLGTVPKKLSDSQTDKFDQYLFYLISSIIKTLGVEKFTITATRDCRQKDGVNCLGFILNDLEVAQSYLSEGKVYFFVPATESSMNTKNFYVTHLLNKFYEISQYQENSSNEFTMLIKEEGDALGNPHALNKSIGSAAGLIKQNLLIFRSANYFEEGESDVDEEIKESCTIM